MPNLPESKERVGVLKKMLRKFYLPQLRRFVRDQIVYPREVERLMSRIARSSSPVVVGPWTTEVGFEVLYWIPWLRQLFRDYGIAPERVVAVSRGGAWPWYHGWTGNYIDLLRVVTPAEFLAGSSSREKADGKKKQFSVSPQDSAYLAAVAKLANLKDYWLVHPSLLYRVFQTMWTDGTSLTRALTLFDHENFTCPLPRPPGFPVDGDYLAVKFYFSRCFPDCSENREMIRNALEHLSTQMPVVLLSAGAKLDDHSDCELTCGKSARIHDVSNQIDPAENLAYQTAVVQHARALICTYGGFSYLGFLLNKPTMAVFSNHHFVASHLQFAYQVLRPRREGTLAMIPSQCSDLFWPMIAQRSRAA